CDNRPGGMDGGITLMDSGMRRDAGRDSGSRDGGPTGCAVTLTATSWPALPAACVPRCTLATLRPCLMACDVDAGAGVDSGSVDAGDVDAGPPVDCIHDCFVNDTTAAASSFTVNGTASTVPLTCGECYDWQDISCVFSSCPTQASAYFTCINGTGT